MLYIDNTLLTILIVLSLGVILGGLALIWKLTAPPPEPTGERPEAKKKQKKDKKDKKKDDTQVVEKKDALSRMRRRRQAAKESSSEEEESSSEDQRPDTDGKDKERRPVGGAGVGILGKKKLQKLQEKEQRAQMREAREAAKKQRESEEDRRIMERMKKEKKEEEERQKEEEELERLRKEREKKEQEEYDAIKHTFEVEAAGSVMDDLETFQNNIDNFIDFIKESKVVFLEDLASKFHIKTQAVVDKILALESEGRLSGIIDEKGKFIYITPEEMTGVAQFIKQRGRVHISEIQRQSNILINLEPKKQTVEDIDEEEEQKA